MIKVCMALIIGGVGCLSVEPLAAFTWNARELPALQGVSIRDMNNAAQIIGNVGNGTSMRAVLFSDGLLHDLGTLGGASSEAYGLNNRGEVVGMSLTANGDRPFIYRNGHMSEIEGLYWANDINDAGVIAGYTGNWGIGALYRDGVVEPLFSQAACRDYCHARKINNSGHVLGQIFSLRELWNGYVYRDGVVRIIDTSSLGDGQFYNVPHDMNDAGVVLGNYAQLDYPGSFLYQDGNVWRIGDGDYPYVWSNSINNAGWVVGRCSGLEMSGAFMYRDGKFTSLNALDLDYAALFGPEGRFIDALEINDFNQILASDHLGRLFLLTPVPEPASGALIGGGMSVLALWKRRPRPGSHANPATRHP